MWLLSNVPFTKDNFIKIAGYCYHLANVIAFSAAIKHLSLYFEESKI